MLLQVITKTMQVSPEKVFGFIIVAVLHSKIISQMRKNIVVIQESMMNILSYSVNYNIVLSK